MASPLPGHISLHPVFYQFLFASLDGEVALGKGDRFLTGVAALGDQVAGVACEHEVFDFPLSALAVGYQFRDATKMIRNIVTRCFLRSGSTWSSRVQVRSAVSLNKNILLYLKIENKKDLSQLKFLKCADRESNPSLGVGNA